MHKIFRYELRRLLRSKLFFGMLLAASGYSWLTLSGSVIRGIAHTAPFSPWSFGYYLSRTLPLLCLGELSFLAFFSSKEERRLRPLTQATPVRQRQYMLLRCGAVLTATALLCLCVAALAVGFCTSLFGKIRCGPLILPALLVLLPPVSFCLGAGLTACRFHPALPCLTAAAAVLLSVPPLPAELRFSLSAFFSQFPLTLETLDPAFQVPVPLAAARLAWFLSGGILTACAIHRTPAARR